MFEPGKTEAPADPSSADGVLDVWAAAFNAADLAGICDLYHPQALLWGTTAQRVIDTTRGVEDYFRAVFQISPPPTVEFEAHVARAFGAVVLLAGTYRLKLVSAGQPHSVPARFSFTL